MFEILPVSWIETRRFNHAFTMVKRQVGSLHCYDALHLRNKLWFPQFQTIFRNSEPTKDIYNHGLLGYRKPWYFTGKAMVSFRFSLKPIHWHRYFWLFGSLRLVRIDHMDNGGNHLQLRREWPLKSPEISRNPLFLETERTFIPLEHPIVPEMNGY